MSKFGKMEVKLARMGEDVAVLRGQLAVKATVDQVDSAVATMYSLIGRDPTSYARPRPYIESIKWLAE